MSAGRYPPRPRAPGRPYASSGGGVKSYVATVPLNVRAEVVIYS
jgi:hypothetical protein